MSRIVVISTSGSKSVAHKIAKDIVHQRLAACLNILPVVSFFRWKGKIRNEREYLLIFKTRSEVFEKLKRRTLALHTYELPEIASLKIDDGYEPYLDWIDGEVMVGS